MTSPDAELVIDDCIDNDGSPAVSDELQIDDELSIGQGYHLRDCSTIEPSAHYGFPCVVIVVAEPFTYQEASDIPEY